MAPSTHATEAQRPGRRRILVVDDSVDLAETLAMVLAEGGHDVRVAHSGADALAQAAAFEPEIVFLDIGMPGMNGYEVAQRLRRQQGERALLLFALSGYAQEQDIERSRAVGFDRHLLKPVDIDMLEQLVAAYPAQ